MTKSISNLEKPVKSSKPAVAEKVLGTTKDGVRILVPRGKPTHFTRKEVRDIVASVIAARKAG